MAAPKTATSKAVAQVAAGIVSEMPEFMKGMESSRGSENVTANDMVIPRLEQVQAISPCIKKNNAEYIEGCQEGDLYNNVTRELYGNEVKLIPVMYKKEYLIWKDRKEGGGFRGAFDTELDAKREMGTLDDGDKCEVIDTAQHFCLVLKEDGSTEEIVVSMSKSKAKISRKWNSLIRLSGGDSFTRVYNIKSIADSNARNEEFANIDVSVAGFCTEPMFRAGEKLYEQIQAGLVKVDRTESTDEVAKAATEY